jgi:hypothetical protein
MLTTLLEAGYVTRDQTRENRRVSFKVPSLERHLGR